MDKSYIRIARLMEEVKLDADDAGIKYSKNISELIINSRVKRRFGACKKRKNILGQEAFSIEISKHILAASDYQIKNILAHELLHTVKGCYNHKSKWKQLANILNGNYNYNITTTTTCDKIEITEPPNREKNKYKIICQGCGAEFYRKRSCPLVNNTEKYRCAACGGKLKTIYL